jgi:3-hydroxyacyl-[acyl-carrier-protein] dehydratase
MSLYTDIQRSKIFIAGSLTKGISGKFNFPGDLEVFKGHFPEKPILPGIAQIEMVKFCLETTLDKKLFIQSIKKTKFSHFIEPDTPVSIHITFLPDTLEGEGEIQISAKATLNASNITVSKINLVFSGVNQKT